MHHQVRECAAALSFKEEVARQHSWPRMLSMGGFDPDNGLNSQEPVLSLARPACRTLLPPRAAAPDSTNATVFVPPASLAAALP